MEEARKEEQLRYDALMTKEMEKVQLELRQLDDEAALLRPLKGRGRAMKSLRRLLIASDVLLREILWSWRFQLPPSLEKSSGLKKEARRDQEPECIIRKNVNDSCQRHEMTRHDTRRRNTTRDA